jgi:hypothetical protein
VTANKKPLKHGGEEEAEEAEEDSFIPRRERDLYRYDVLQE